MVKKTRKEKQRNREKARSMWKKRTRTVNGWLNFYLFKKKFPKFYFLNFGLIQI